MRKETIKVLGIESNLDVPASIQEFDQNAKKEGAALETAIWDVLYHRTFSDIRDVFLHGDEEKDGDKVVRSFKGLEELSGLDRKTKKVKTEKGKEVEEYDEKEQAYFDRVKATIETKGPKIDLVALMQAAATYVGFNAAASARKPAGPKKLAQKYQDVANDFLSGKKSLDKLNTALSKTLGKTFTKSGDAEKDKTTLGWLCKEFADAQDVFSKVG